MAQFNVEGSTRHGLLSCLKLKVKLKVKVKVEGEGEG